MTRKTAAILFALGAALLLSACATGIPPARRVANPGPGVPAGPARALAAGEDTVFALNDSGLFARAGSQGRWAPQPLPDGVGAKEVTVLAWAGSDLALGTRANGVHLLRDGAWTAARAADGSLPDDEVLALGWEREGEGLAGNTLWVGTSTGLARRAGGGKWEVFTPQGNWLEALSPFTPPADEDVFAILGTQFGAEGGGKDAFRPPVTAVAAGPGGVAFGNGNGKIAIVAKGGGVGVFSPDGVSRVTVLAMEKGSVWAGTAKGLFWGGNPGVVSGRPNPSWRGVVPSFPVVFGPRDLRGFDYRWYQVGFNTAAVTALALDGRRSLWIGQRGEIAPVTFTRDPLSNAPPPGSSGFRRYPNPAENMARGADLLFEEYGSSLGISGVPLSLTVGKDSVWLGSEKGVFRVK